MLCTCLLAHAEKNDKNWNRSLGCQGNAKKRIMNSEPQACIQFPSYLQQLTARLNFNPVFIHALQFMT